MGPRVERTLQALAIQVMVSMICCWRAMGQSVGERRHAFGARGTPIDQLSHNREVSDEMAENTDKHDIALSFAGEDRAYVDEVATELRMHNVRVFYHPFVVADTWGAHLYAYFSDIFQNKAKFVIAFISAHYARKAWPRHERRSAQARSPFRRQPHFLPVRLDVSELQGLLPTIGYIDGRVVPPTELVGLILEKLDHSTVKPIKSS